MDPRQLPRASAGSPTGLAALLELHIEQGRLLESDGKAVGPGGGRRRATPACGSRCTGRADHSGGTPMHIRKDALAAAAEIVLGVERLANEPHRRTTVATVGRLDVSPNSITTVPARVTFYVDVRDVDGDRQRAAAQDVLALAQQVAARRDVGIEAELVGDSSPVVLPLWLRHLTRDVCQQLEVPYRVLNSGAGHDAAILARALPGRDAVRAQPPGAQPLSGRMDEHLRRGGGRARAIPLDPGAGPLADRAGGMSDFPAGVTLGLLPPREAERAEPRFVAAPITAQYAVAPEHYLMRLRDAAIARGVPGQFVMVKPTRVVDVHPLLPRPMAIYRYLPASDEFEIVYRVIGTGTRVMSERNVGEAAELVGPVGQGFRLLENLEGLLVHRARHRYLLGDERRGARGRAGRPRVRRGQRAPPGRDRRAGPVRGAGRSGVARHRRRGHEHARAGRGVREPTAPRATGAADPRLRLEPADRPGDPAGGAVRRRRTGLAGSAHGLRHRLLPRLLPRRRSASRRKPPWSAGRAPCSRRAWRPAAVRPAHRGVDAQPATGRPGGAAGRPARPSNGRGRGANG